MSLMGQARPKYDVGVWSALTLIAAVVADVANFA